jgi:peptidoglycan/LPS O-acetylase OafA/YrhL
MRKIISLDALRGYAVLLVIVNHIPAIGDNFIGRSIAKFAEITNAGYLGVQIFFVLSGFLISRILLKEKRTGEVSFKRFYIKRFLRIFPIYYLSIVVFGILINWKNALPVALYISNYWFIFYHGDSHWRITWSLAVEEHFYLFWPLLIYSLSINKSLFMVKYAIPITILLMAIGTVLLVPHALANAMLIRASHFQIFSLCVGSYLAFIEEDICRIKRSYLLLVIGALIISLLIGRKFNEIDAAPNNTFMQMISPIFILLFYSFCGVILLILFLNIPNNKYFTKTIIGKPIQFMGRISYGIYLYHYSILYLFKITYPQIGGARFIPVKTGVTALIVTLVVAVASYFIIERPLLRLKDRISNNWFAKQKVLEAL